ncbi:hypothetical protein D3C78_1881340 [compost metagenome]
MAATLIAEVCGINGTVIFAKDVYLLAISSPISPLMCMAIISDKKPTAAGIAAVSVEPANPPPK